MPEVRMLDKDGRWNKHSEDEHLWWPRVLWIDPGVVSGVAVVWFDPKALLLEDKPTAKVILAYSELFLHGPENGPSGQVHTFVRLHHKLDEEAGLATGCESFVPRKLIQDDDFVSPIRIRSGIDYALSMLKNGASVRNGRGAPLHVQAPVDALNVFTNERLKNLNMYRPGPDHVNDAKRHALLWIRRLKESSRGIEFFKQAHGYEEGWFA